MGCQEFHISRRHPKAQDVTEQKILVVMSKVEEAMLQGFATRPISTSFQFIPEWINSFCFLLLWVMIGRDFSRTLIGTLNFGVFVKAHLLSHVCILLKM
jgi:hypothetical protein